MRAAGILRTVGRHAARLARSRRGNVAILVALTVPVILTASLGGLNVIVALSKRQELRDIAQTVCNRALKPTRMNLYEDAERQAQGEVLFDAMAQKARFTIASRAVSAGWLSAQVTASAHVSAISNAPAGAGGITIAVDEKCAGVPPYPAKGDSILTSKFTKPNGTPLLMMFSDWGVYKPQDFGWDGGTGPGIEIQDWCKGFGDVPQGSDNCFVVELDSHGGPSSNPGNSSMYRRVELHRGTYRFSFWYYGRQPDPTTNRISVYLEGVRPASAKVQKLTVAEPASKGWLYQKFEITVSSYSIYNLWIAAEGTDDTLGGNFNDLELTYIKRPPELYTD